MLCRWKSSQGCAHTFRQHAHRCAVTWHQQQPAFRIRRRSVRAAESGQLIGASGAGEDAVLSCAREMLKVEQLKNMLVYLN